MRLAKTHEVSESRIVTGPMVPNGVRDQDVRVLIGLLAVIEAEIMAGEYPQHMASRLQNRFVYVGLLSAISNSRDLRQAINDLNHRLRYARGEYEEPPTPVELPD